MGGLIAFIIILGIWGGFALIPAAIARGKGRNGLEWWVYGFFIWPVALIHALLLSATEEARTQELKNQGHRKCPFCAEMVKPDATVCRYCNRDLPVAVVVAVAPTQGDEGANQGLNKPVGAFFREQVQEYREATQTASREKLKARLAAFRTTEKKENNI
jgi:hypothetical protein